MEILSELNQYIYNQILETEKQIQFTAIDLENLKEIKSYVSNLDASALDLEDLKLFLKETKLYENKLNQLLSQINKITSIQKLLQLLNSSNKTLNKNDEVLYYLDQATKQIIEKNINILNLQSYVNSLDFNDEELKKNINLKKQEIINIINQNLIHIKKELIKNINEILNHHLTKTISKKRSNEKYNKVYLETLKMYFSFFDENVIIKPFKSRKELESFFEFLMNSSLNKDSIFNLIILFSKFNIDYYNNLKNIKNASIKIIVDKQVEKANENLENLIDNDKEVIEEATIVENKNAEIVLTQAEIELYNEVKKIIDTFESLNIDNDYYELFKDDFVLSSRMDYYEINNKIDWSVIVTDFKKILEPNIETHKEEIIEIFKYIIELNKKQIKAYKELLCVSESIESILKLHQEEVLFFNKLNDKEKNIYLRCFEFLEKNDLEQLEQYISDVLKINYEQLSLFYILNKLMDLKDEIKDIKTDYKKEKTIDKEILETIIKIYEEIKKEYNNLASNLKENNNVSKENAELINPHQKNFVCIFDDSMQISNENERKAINSCVEYVKYHDWSKFTLEGHIWDLLKYKLPNGKEKNYMDEEFAAGRIRRNDYRVGLVVIKNICEDTKHKLKTRSNLEKIGVIALVLGAIYVKANHNLYSEFNKIISDNKSSIDEYVRLFKDPNTPEEVLFDIIEKGINDCKLIEDGQWGIGVK